MKHLSSALLATLLCSSLAGASPFVTIQELPIRSPVWTGRISILLPGPTTATC